MVIARADDAARLHISCQCTNTAGYEQPCIVGVCYTVKWGEADDRVLGDSTCHRVGRATLGHAPPLHTHRAAGCQTS